MPDFERPVRIYYGTHSNHTTLSYLALTRSSLWARESRHILHFVTLSVISTCSSQYPSPSLSPRCKPRSGIALEHNPGNVVYPPVSIRRRSPPPIVISRWKKAQESRIAVRRWCCTTRHEGLHTLEFRRICPPRRMNSPDIPDSMPSPDARHSLPP